MGADRLHLDALYLLLEGIRAADPYEAVKKSLSIRGSSLLVRGLELGIEGDLYLIAFGKASYGMARAAMEILGDRVKGGVVSIPRGLEVGERLEGVDVVEGGHPRPDEGSLRAGRAALEVAERAGEGDLVLVLISGGGSALLECPVEGVSLEEISETSIALMKAGADIYELNTVRKHLSRVKGGWLAKAIYPAETVALVIPLPSATP